MTRSTAPNYSVPALEKGLDILEALSASAVPLTLSNLSRELDRSNTEIFRMLNLLEARRYIIRDEAGGYRLSLKLFQIANSQCSVRQLIDAALPAMRELSAKSLESCHLSVLEGAEMVVLARTESPTPVRLTIEVGGRFLALNTVSGRMLLAGYSVEARKRILEGSASYRAMKPPAQRALQRGMEKVARDGFSTAVSETVAGVVDAAVAIGSPGSGVHAALALSSLLPSGRRANPKAFVPSLRACARVIEDLIGYRTRDRPQK